MCKRFLELSQRIILLEQKRQRLVQDHRFANYIFPAVMYRVAYLVVGNLGIQCFAFVVFVICPPTVHRHVIGCPHAVRRLSLRLRFTGCSGGQEAQAVQTGQAGQAGQVGQHTRQARYDLLCLSGRSLAVRTLESNLDFKEHVADIRAFLTEGCVCNVENNI